MEEVYKMVQKTSTHIASCVTADGAGYECDVAANEAAIDPDAATLHPEKGTSIQRGDG